MRLVIEWDTQVSSESKPARESHQQRARTIEQIGRYMSVIISLTAVGPQDSVLTLDQFTTLVSEALDVWLAEHPKKRECLVMVVSGAGLIEEGYTEPYSGSEYPDAIDLTYFSERMLPDEARSSFDVWKTSPYRVDY